MTPGDQLEVVLEVLPERNLRALYLVYLLFIVWGGILIWLVPLVFFIPPFPALAISVPLLVIILLAVWWTGAYYRTIRYRFTRFEIAWERGVWFRQTGIVPYYRITNMDIMQGPLSRFFGLSQLKVQTAGYSVGSASTAELKIDGLREPEPVRQFIRKQMQGGAGAPRAPEGTGVSVDEKILAEVVAIRSLLEERLP